MAQERIGQVAVIFAGTQGYLDKLKVSDVGRFEEGLLSLLRTEHKSVLDTIATEKQLTDDTRAKLKAALDSYAKSFA